MGHEHSAQVTVVAVGEPFEAAAAQLREQAPVVYPIVEELFIGSELDGVPECSPAALSHK